MGIGMPGDSSARCSLRVSDTPTYPVWRRCYAEIQHGGAARPQSSNTAKTLFVAGMGSFQQRIVRLSVRPFGANWFPLSLQDWMKAVLQTLEFWAIVIILVT